MPTVSFLGKIVPATAFKVEMWGLPKLTVKFAEIDLEVELSVEIQNGAISVQCSAARVDDEARTYIHKIAYDIARSAINLMSFKTGTYFHVFFDQYRDEAGVVSPFAIQHPNLASLVTAYDLVSEDGLYGPGDISKFLWAEPALFMAFDDLITSASLHSLLTVNAARAIEGLRGAMAPVGMPRKEQWGLFQSNLRLSEAYLRLITDNSQSGRHGEHTHIPGTITTEITKRCWVIMNRFLEFRKRGNKPLPLAEFPLLDA